jgi:hypothetical protein
MPGSEVPKEAPLKSPFEAQKAMMITTPVGRQEELRRRLGARKQQP